MSRATGVCLKFNMRCDKFNVSGPAALLQPVAVLQVKGTLDEPPLPLSHVKIKNMNEFTKNRFGDNFMSKLFTVNKNVCSYTR
jgi:hypothetical protein